MKLIEYIKNLQDFALANPEALEMTVIYSKDAEGNGYDMVYYPPTLGEYDEEEKDFQQKEILIEAGYGDDLNINAVCIN